MEQKKALRIGKLNIVDIVAIILVLLVAVYGAYRLLGQVDAPAATYPVTYVVRAEDVPKELYESMARCWTGRSSPWKPHPIWCWVPTVSGRRTRIM